MSQQPNYKHYTRGGQISFHNLRMWDQITKTLVMICLVLWVMFSGVLTWLFTSGEMLAQTLSYHYARFLDVVGQKHTFTIPYHGHSLKQTVAVITHHPFYARTADVCLHLFYKAALISFFASLALGGILTVYFVRKGKQQSGNQFIRGSQIQKNEVVKRQIIKNKANSDITIDGFPLIKNSEVQHLLVHGTVGTGKSQLIMKILDCLRSRGDRVIVYDKGCSFIPHYFREGTDVLLNPFDARCANWDMWLEAPRDSDFENMAESLIPMHGESDPFWVNAARTVFTSVAIRMRHDPEQSLDKLLKLLLTSEFSNLEQYLTGTAAATLVNGKIEKTAISIRSVITTYLKSLQSLSGLKENENQDFSIRDYILDDKQSGWLFISSNGEQHKSLKPLMSMWLAMASLTMLSLTPDPNRRIWVICDELPSLHKLPLLGETIAEVRKFGGCFLLGMQSFSQLDKVYGRCGAAELFDLLNTRFFFRSPSSDMARLVSSELGEEDLDESRENYSYGANSVRDGISLGTQRIARPIVSYPEILELPNLACYVRLPGEYPVTRLDLQHCQRDHVADPLTQRILPSVSHFEDLKPINLEDKEQQIKAPGSKSQAIAPSVRVSEYLD